MATRPRCNGVDWLMLPCDTSQCDLSPERIPEKYRRPVNSAIKGCTFESNVSGGFLLEHLATLLTSTFALNCELKNSLNKAIGIINLAKHFLIFIDDTMI